MWHKDLYSDSLPTHQGFKDHMEMWNIREDILIDYKSVCSNIYLLELIEVKQKDKWF